MTLVTVRELYGDNKTASFILTLNGNYIKKKYIYKLYTYWNRL